MNFSGTDIGEPSAAGCFPGGASPYGCEEMAGNLWEWTSTRWADGEPYPASPLERSARDSLDGPDRRVVRGGAFSFNGYVVRCAVRNDRPPELRDYYLGFRCAVSPLL